MKKSYQSTDKLLYAVLEHQKKLRKALRTVPQDKANEIWEGWEKFREDVKNHKFHDYLSPLDSPKAALIIVLGNFDAHDLIEQVQRGKFDATLEESEGVIRGLDMEDENEN